MTEQVENGLSDNRLEWVEETTCGVPPTDPAWNLFSDAIGSTTPVGDSQVEGNRAKGSGDFTTHTGGPRDDGFEVTYWIQRQLVDGSGNPQDPAAFAMTYDYNSTFTSHTIVERREVTSGGADGAGFREYYVALGARPVNPTIDGDPSASEPLPVNLTYEAEFTRQYVIDQPSASTTLDLVSDDNNDTQDVIIESEDAATTDQVTLTGTTPVTTTESFPNIDSVYVVGQEHAGTITVSDGSGTTFLELSGTNDTRRGGYEEGVPALGTGSHASAIGADYEQFLGTSATFAGGQLAQTPAEDRVHTLNTDVSLDVSKEPVQSSDRPQVDIGPRTISIDADVAGPYESAEQNRQYYRLNSGDIVYTFSSTQVTFSDATRTDVDDPESNAEDANIITGVTFEPEGISVAQA